MSIAAYQLDGRNCCTCVVVGLGLIGSSISTHLALRFRPIRTVSQTPQEWSNPEELILKIKSIIKLTNAKHLELIWSAGKAGFSASTQDMSLEYDCYEQTINSLLNLDNLELTVSLISTAGGIYENSNLVNDLSVESPSRPYAVGKLKQEALLIKMGLRHRVYRASSVYGIGGSRAGLINTMLRSANLREPMMIYSNQNTLRDYIYNEDLAKLIVNDIISNNGHGTNLIASGRATSVNMLLFLVRNITNKPVMASFCPDDTNSKNIVFARHLVSKKPTPTTLEEGIRILNKRMLLVDQY